ncbi:hypothetical protein Sango_2313600 [Sesamum angolense]|uniref:Uncharacterized protein n=1 Tax=Sesamum angolense TaxID=2727404 RepID=A0AAE2BLG8_9LAMI|nr:hypothetical protein Sango_2313600 [Sesamum angolense]
MAERILCAYHGIKMLSLVKKFDDLKAELDNDKYIDVILQSLRQSYDPFIINYNMNGLEKSINELINMMVQIVEMTHKFEPAVLVGEPSISKAKSNRAGCWKRKKKKAKIVATTTRAAGAPTALVGMGKEK